MVESLRNWISGLLVGQAPAVAILVELLFIALCVYAVLRLLRGTRGESLFRGVALVLLSGTLVMKILAERFQLDRILVIYREFVLGIFFVGLIVFQPELRRALMRLGAAGWLPGFRRETAAELDELIEAVGYMARNKIGALIAIERTSDLGAWATGGCKLDAELTAPLLMTIFWPGTALHDMGVILAQGRIVAAAVPFPMSYEDVADPMLGSRHRAALGLSEDTDALVIVVSEETGIISLAEGGQLHRRLTPEQLRTQLAEGLGRRAPRPEPETVPPSTENP